MTLEDRFWSKVNKRGTIHPGLKTRCWNWTASTFRTGYGQFGLRGTMTTAHRVAYTLIYGPTSKLVLHKCDNRLCVNPAHLFIGTHKDNTQDMLKKGRESSGVKHSLTVRGIKNGRVVLTEDQVQEVLNWKPRSGETLRAVATRFRVALVTLEKIRTGKNWKHISSKGKL